MAGAAVPFETFAAAYLLEQREAIARAWVERITAEIQVRPRRALPTDAMLDSIPDVLRRVAEFLASEDESALSSDPVVREALAALARLRHGQGHDVQELIRELHLLARVLDGACLEWLGSYPGSPDPAAVVRVTGRLNRAPILLGEISAGAFVELERERVGTLADLLLHELRTPLGAAETAAVILENDGIVAQARERRRFAVLIQRNLRRATQVIGDLREIALDALARRGDRDPLPIGPVLGAVLAEVRDAAGAAGVRVDVEEPIPDVRVDAIRVELVLLNLLGNAIKYADPAQPVRWARLRLGAVDAGEEGWWLEVSDNGIGIPAEHQARIFERSYRAHPQRASGSGLGLAIVREAVRQLGGSIRVQSEPGAGTTFHVHVPGAPCTQESR